MHFFLVVKKSYRLGVSWVPSPEGGGLVPCRGTVKLGKNPWLTAKSHPETVIREDRQPLAPTAASWLRNRPRPGAR